MSELIHGDQVRICASLELCYADRIGLKLSFFLLISWRTSDESKHSLGRLKRNEECHNYMVSTLIDADKLRGT